MSLSTRELLDAAVSVELVESSVVEDLSTQARRRGEDPLEAVSAHCRLPLAMLYRAAAESMGLPFVDLRGHVVDGELLTKLPPALLRRHGVVPVRADDGHVMLATTEPRDQAALRTAERLLGSDVALAIADPTALDATLASLSSGGAEPSGVDPVVFLDRVMREAVLRRASDIHVEPEREAVRVRYRIDGRLQEDGTRLTLLQGQAIVSRIKVLASLDISENRAPQDGGFRFEHGEGASAMAVDMRVATVPTRWGEKATLRLLGASGEVMSLGELGMSDEDVALFADLIRRPYGMVFITGPTGSGKSTTLYAALSEISDPSINVMTVEDPIEHPVDGISQVQIGGSKVGFAGVLRSLLRHDPDVLMVGEVRDSETADVALKAAMTGHLVFSTLHTNDAVSAVTRLRDLGCESYLVGSTLVLVVAQRLVMKLCARCAVERDATVDEREWLGAETNERVTVKDPVGCAACLGQGFRGRLGLFEMLPVDVSLGRMIGEGEGEGTLRDHAAGCRRLVDDGRAKVRAGLTSIAEVQRVVGREI